MADINTKSQNIIHQQSVLNSSNKIWMISDISDFSVDHLKNIEQVRFNDKSVALDIDAGDIGADFAAASKGNAIWSGHSLKGDPDSLLYSVVNAMHRNGVDQDSVAIRFTGLIGTELTEVFKKFFIDVDYLGESKWYGLKLLAK